MAFCFRLIAAKYHHSKWWANVQKIILHLLIIAALKPASDCKCPEHCVVSCATVYRTFYWVIPKQISYEHLNILTLWKVHKLIVRNLVHVKNTKVWRRLSKKIPASSSMTMLHIKYPCFFPLLLFKGSQWMYFVKWQKTFFLFNTLQEIFPHNVIMPLFS